LISSEFTLLGLMVGFLKWPINNFEKALISLFLFFNQMSSIFCKKKKNLNQLPKTDKYNSRHLKIVCKLHLFLRFCMKYYLLSTFRGAEEFPFVKFQVFLNESSTWSSSSIITLKSVPFNLRSSDDQL